MITMYGAEMSLYSGKARSYLRKQGFDFEEVKASLKIYKNIIIPNTGVRYIPVVKTTDGQYLQDTSVIIDELEKVSKAPSVYPSTPKQRLAAQLLEVYGDEWLLIPAMHYRWNFPNQNQPFIFQEFGSVIFPNAPAFLRRFIGKRIGAKFQGFVPGLGINQQSIPAIEASYQSLLAELDAHFADHLFLFGARPSIADFGLIGPMYAHLYRDPAPGELMKGTAPKVAAWVERMLSEEIFDRDFLANDEVPETLLPVLKRMVSEQLPVISDTQRRLDSWQAQNPGEREVPRRMGDHQVKFGESEVSRVVLPFSLWKWQRPVDFYESQSDKVEMDALLSACGFDTPLQNAQTRLERVDNVIQVLDSKPK